MTLEKRIKKISEASGLSEQEVKELIEKKKEEAAGLLTDHGAVYALEKEHGIGSEGEAKAEYTKISDLKPDLSNVNVLGAIKEIRPIKKFSTEKRSGQLARMLLADSTGEATVVMWDKTAEIVDSDRIAPGSVISIRNGYTRKGLDGNPEVHVGGLSRILIDPKTLDEKLLKGLPKVEEDLKKISELKEGDVVSTQGRVLYLYEKSEFDRSDGRKGQRASMIIEDETGKLRVVMWDANADRAEKFGEGDVVKVESGQVRQGNRGLEIHIGSRGRILPSEAKMDLPEREEAKARKIAEIEPGMQNVSVSGRVMRILPIKEFVSGDRTGKMASLILVDDTGITRAVLWEDKADLVKDISQGDTVTVKNGYTKQSLNGDAEVHLSRRGGLQVNPPDVSIEEMGALISKHAEEKKISDIKPDDRNIGITGKIEDVDENPMVFEICSECGSRIENVAGEWMCDVCGEATPAYGMVVSCGVSDGSGDVRAVFYRDLAEELTGLSVPEALNLIGQSGDELEPIRRVKDELAGKKVSLIGNVRYNDYQDRLELMVSSISSISGSSTPKKSVSKKKDDIPEEVPKEALEDDIEVEEITLDE